MGSSGLSLDEAAHGFAAAARAYSPAPIWWWSGEKLERARLRRQLEQFAAGGVYNLVILNLAPAGPLYGSDADDPPFFSEAWWEIFLGVCADARELGVRLWFYDQIGFSGANLQGGLVREDPRRAGQWLASAVVEGEGPLALAFPPAGQPLAVVVTNLQTGETVTTPVGEPVGGPVDGSVGRPVGGPQSEQGGLIEVSASPAEGQEGSGSPRNGGGSLWRYTPPPGGAGGRWRLRLVYVVRRGYDYLGVEACARLLDTVHGEYARRAQGFFGDVIVGSFQDELPSMPTWGEGFAAAFAAQHGYDLLAQLGRLWEGEEPQAQAVRVHFHATRAALAEAAFFIPLFDWHAGHGLICGFDQQGPARAGDPVETVTLYADYLKTHRWFGAPGSDHHGEAKVHSSLAHLYGRPRVWIESFHSSGWGGTLEETFDWLLPWLRAGANLYDPHAVYYSTRGGWWEWAPPSTCWRQPYWRHYGLFAGAVSRLCYLLSQGDHVCDVGVLFPTVTVQAHTTPEGTMGTVAVHGGAMPGALAAARAAHTTYTELVGRMVWFDAQPGVLDRDRRDFDVLDDDSLQRGIAAEGALAIGRERYRAIVLPWCVALAEATAVVLCRFVEAGGLLVAVGMLPAVAISLAGAEGSSGAVARLREMAAEGADETAASGGRRGKVVCVATAEEVPLALAGLPRAVEGPVPLLHRRISGHDVVFVPAAKNAAGRASEVRTEKIWWNIQYTFDAGRYARAMVLRVRRGVNGEFAGAPALWNPLDGTRRALAWREVEEGMEVVVPFEENPAALVVWEGTRDEPRAGEGMLENGRGGEGDWGDRRGEKTGASAHGAEATGASVHGAGAAAAPHGEVLRLEEWRAQVEPTLDNRYGDFDRPAQAGTVPLQTWRFEHWVEGEERRATVEATFGPYGWVTGPHAREEFGDGGPGGRLVFPEGWRQARYSLARGIAHDPVHNHTLGPKGHVPYEFLAFGAVRPGEAVRFRTTVVLKKEQIGEGPLYLALAAGAAKRLWVNEVAVGEGPPGYLWLEPLALRAGRNAIEWELAPEEAVELRAAWAIVRDPQRFARPEWMTPGDALGDGPGNAPGDAEKNAGRADTLVRFTGRFDVPFAPQAGTLHTATAFGARVILNGVEVGRQGGFDPYGFQMRVYRHTSTAFVCGLNTVTLEVHDPGRLVEALVDVRVVGPQGEEAHLMSGAHWEVQRGDETPRPVALRRFQNISWNAGEVAITLDPQAVDLWRRPHPLPGADWIEDAPSDGTVLRVTPDALGGQARAEWLRWVLPPGVRRMQAPLQMEIAAEVAAGLGEVRLLVDGVEIPLVATAAGSVWEAMIPPGEGMQREVRLRVSTAGGHSEGGLLKGPVTYGELDEGPIGLGPWAENGLDAYSGGVRYRSTLVMEEAHLPDGPVWLDLGEVRGTAEVWVNGQLLGVRLWAPYRVAVAGALRAGENVVEVLVLNTLGPYMRAASPTNYVFSHQEVSGLLGPVRVVRG